MVFLPTKVQDVNSDTTVFPGKPWVMNYSATLGLVLDDGSSLGAGCFDPRRFQQLEARRITAPSGKSPLGRVRDQLVPEGFRDVADLLDGNSPESRAW